MISICESGIKGQKQLPIQVESNTRTSLTKLIIVNLPDYTAKLLTAEH